MQRWTQRSEQHAHPVCGPACPALAAAAGGCCLLLFVASRSICSALTVKQAESRNMHHVSNTRITVYASKFGTGEIPNACSAIPAGQSPGQSRSPGLCTWAPCHVPLGSLSPAATPMAAGAVRSGSEIPTSASARASSIALLLLPAALAAPLLPSPARVKDSTLSSCSRGSEPAHAVLRCCPCCWASRCRGQGRGTCMSCCRWLDMRRRNGG